MQETQAEATPIRNKEREERIRRDVNDLLLKHLNGGTTIAELEMLSDRVRDVIDSWNRNGR